MAEAVAFREGVEMPLSSLPVFADRREAGRRLAERLARFARRSVVVLALPRGGVPVAEVVAERLHAPLDVFVVRKVGAPGNPEYALGAVAEGGTVMLDEARVRECGLEPSDLRAEVRQQEAEVERRVRRYRGHRPPPDVEGKTVLLVDDGLATGATARSAVRALKMRRPQRLVLAVGVASAEAFDELSREVDELVCPCVPSRFYAVGEWYRDFSEVTDEQVVAILARHAPTAVPPLERA